MKNLNTLLVCIITNFISKKPMFVISFLLVVSAFYTANAQFDFRGGYYITLENDTIHGLLDYRGDVKNAQACIFKKTDSAESVRFNPGEINAYRFTEGKFYISRQIKTGDEERMVFLEFLVDGITNLYFFRDINYYVYFLEDKNGKLLELSNETITEKIDGKSDIQRNTNRHIGVMKATFADCKEIQPQINNVSLTHKSLIKLTKKYHDYVCDDDVCIVYEKTIQPITVRFAPVLKAGVADLKFDVGFFTNYNFNPELFYGVGFLTNVVFPGINEKLSFEAGLDFNVYNLHGYFEVQNGTIMEYYNVYFDFFSLQPTLAIKYTFPTGKIKPTIALGGYADFFSGINEKVVSARQYPDTTITHTTTETPLAHGVFGGFLQLGLNYDIAERTFFTNIRVSHAEKLENGVSSIIQSVNLNLGMFLDKRKKQ